MSKTQPVRPPDWSVRSEITYAVMASVLVAAFAIFFWLLGG